MREAPGKPTLDIMIMVYAIVVTDGYGPGGPLTEPQPAPTAVARR